MSTKNNAIQKAVIVSPSIDPSVFDIAARDHLLAKVKKQKSQTFVTRQIEWICCDEGLALRNSLRFCLRIGYALLIRSAHQYVGFRKAACTCAAKLLPFCQYIFASFLVQCQSESLLATGKRYVPRAKSIPRIVRSQSIKKEILLRYLQQKNRR
jgi:hypothetical protein